MQQGPWLESVISFPFCELHCLGGLLSSRLGIQTSGITGFSSKNTGMGCHALLQGIFLTQVSNPRVLCLLVWQMDSLPLGHLGSPWETMFYRKTCVPHVSLSPKFLKKIERVNIWTFHFLGMYPTSSGLFHSRSANHIMICMECGERSRYPRGSRKTGISWRGDVPAGEAAGGSGRGQRGQMEVNIKFWCMRYNEVCLAPVMCATKPFLLANAVGC